MVLSSVQSVILINPQMISAKPLAPQTDSNFIAVPALVKLIESPTPRSTLTISHVERDVILRIRRLITNNGAEANEILN